MSRKATGAFALLGIVLVIACLAFVRSGAKADPRSGTGGMEDPGPARRPAPRPDPVTPEARARAAAKEKQASPLYQEWDRLREGLDPRLAKELLDRLRREVPNLDERAVIAQQIISRLCAKGYAEEAWSLLDSGYGDMRSRQLDAFFSQAALPTDRMLEKMTTLTDDGDKACAISGFLQHMSLDELTAFDFKLLGVDSRRERYAVTGDIQGKFLEIDQLDGPNARKKSDALLKGVGELFKSGVLEAQDMGTLLKEDRQHGGFEQWDFINGLAASSSLDAKSLDEVRLGVINRMVNDDAARTMGILMESQGAPGKAGLQQALNTWLESDNDSASQWYKANLSRMTPAQKDQAAAAFVETGIKYGDWASAGQWVNDIADPGLRSRLETRLKTRKAGGGK